jgi:hypothetical protein
LKEGQLGYIHKIYEVLKALTADANNIHTRGNVDHLRAGRASSM